MVKTKKSFLYIILALFLSFAMVFMAGCFDKPNKNPVDDGGDNTPIVNPTDDDEDNDDDPPEEQTSVNVLAFGDSISAGYAISGSDMKASYDAYVNKDTAINEMCYTNLIAQKLAEEYLNVNVKSYAKSGDKTADLINILNNQENLYPSVQADINNADVITLCIGANNVLGALLDGGESSLIAQYLAVVGIKTMFSQPVLDSDLDNIRTALQTGLDQFKQDYTNTILPKLTAGKAKVYVMTIYDPMKYFDSTEIQVTGDNKAMVEAILPYFNDAKELAISYLNQINDYIRENSEIENVVVVDVNAKFETINSAQTYRTYINADSSQITLDSSDITNIAALQSNPYFDPHPTSVGQRYIANVFLQAMEKTQIPLYPQA